MASKREELIRFVGEATSQLSALIPELVFILDHVCYRVEKDSEYPLVKELFNRCGRNVLEEEVSGRMVSLFKLDLSLTFGKYTLWYVEIPAPKEGKPFKAGFEHIDVVIETPLADFIATYSFLTFDTVNLSKGKRPEISLKLPSGRVVKFANTPLVPK